MVTEASPAPVSVIGLGMMGAALAGAYLKGGHRTTVWNRSPEEGDALVDQGAVRAGSVADAVAASDILVLCIVDYQAVREILDPVRENLAGKVIVNLTSGLPDPRR